MKKIKTALTAGKLIKRYDQYCSLLSEFYNAEELNDFYLDVGEVIEFMKEHSLIEKCLEKNDIEPSEDIANVIIMSVVNEKLGYAYKKNMEKLEYGFPDAKVDIPRLYAEDLIKGAKAFAEKFNKKDSTAQKHQ